MITGRTSGRAAAKKASQAIAILAADNQSANNYDKENVDSDDSNAQSESTNFPKNIRDDESARNTKRSKARELEAFSDNACDRFQAFTNSSGKAAPSKCETLFSKISSSASAINSAVKQLVGDFQNNPDKGIADILCLVVEAAGLPSSKVSIRAEDILSAQPVQFVKKLCRTFNDVEFTTPLSSRPKTVKDNFRNFWLKFIREAEPMLSENEGLIFQLHEWLYNFSSSTLLSLRLAATEASLLVITGLAQVAGSIALSGGDSEKVKSLERIMSEFMSAAFVHRFRDIDKGVRLSCIKALGDWVSLHPSMFSGNQYLKYLGRSFNDPQASNRDCAAQVVHIIILEGKLVIPKQYKDTEDTDIFMLQCLCDFILHCFEVPDNLDKIVDALFPHVASLGKWDTICKILSTYGDGDLKLAQFDTLSKMLQSSIRVAFGAAVDRYPRSFSLQEQTLSFTASFTEVLVRKSTTDPALFAAVACVTKAIKVQKIPAAAVPQFAELGRRLLDVIEANSCASTCNHLAEAAAACSMLGNSEGEASSRASVIALKGIKTKGKKSRSPTGFVDMHALMRSSALFRYFDIRESNVAHAALAVSQGASDDEVTKFYAVEVMFLHANAMWSRNSDDSGAREWFGKAIEAAFALSENCSSPSIEALCCACIYDCRHFVEMPGNLTAAINQKAYQLAASPDKFESPALQVEHDEEIRKMGLSNMPCGSNGKLVRLAVGRYVLFNASEAVDDNWMHLNDAPITAAACVALQASSAEWLSEVRGEIKKRISSTGLAKWDSCLMEKMFTMVHSAEESDTDTIAQQMMFVCTNLVTSYYTPGKPANQQQDLFNQVLSIVKRGLRFALPPQQDNDKTFFLEFCLAPLVSKVPEECKKMCQDLVTRHVYQVIYELDYNGNEAVGALMTALGSEDFVAPSNRPPSAIAAPFKTAAIAVKPATTAIKAPASTSAKPADTAKSATSAKPAAASKGASAKAAAPKSTAASKPAASQTPLTASKRKQPAPAKPAAAKPVAKAAAGQKKTAKGKAKQGSESEASYSTSEASHSESSDSDSPPVVTPRALKTKRAAATRCNELISKLSKWSDD